MPIIGDDCDETIDSLDEANEVDGEILCDMCAPRAEDDEDDNDGSDDDAVQCFGCKARRAEGSCKHALRECAKCTYRVPECALIDRQEPGKVCPYCAHAHELSIFTPPDHEAAKCSLCTRK